MESQLDIDRAAAPPSPRWKGGSRHQGSKRKHPYNEVHVLLLSWKYSHKGVRKAMIELSEVFKDGFYFTTVETYEIPSNFPYTCLNNSLHRFQLDCGNWDNLLIVYYGGHGSIDKNMRMKWAEHTPASAPSGVLCPTVDWSAMQKSLEHSPSDVLIMLDCCMAAGAIGSYTRGELPEGGRTEILAACGFTSMAYDGPVSFTSCLIKELREIANAPTFPPDDISVATLHKRILGRTHNSNTGQDWDSEDDHRETPIYISLNSGNLSSSIILKPYRAYLPSNTPADTRIVDDYFHGDDCCGDLSDQDTDVEAVEGVTASAELHESEACSAHSDAEN